MRTWALERTQTLPRDRDEVFAFFEDATNLARITPSFLDFSILTPAPITMRAGTTIEYRIALFGVPMRWRTEIEQYVPGERFVDVQVRGPYRVWRHVHEFVDVPGGTKMFDRVEYAVGFGPFGTVARELFVRRALDRIFDFRRDTIAEIFDPERAPAA